MAAARLGPRLEPYLPSNRCYRCYDHYYHFSTNKANQMTKQALVDLLKERCNELGADSVGTLIYLQYVSSTAAAVAVVVVAVARCRHCGGF